MKKFGARILLAAVPVLFLGAYQNSYAADAAVAAQVYKLGSGDPATVAPAPAPADAPHFLPIDRSKVLNTKTPMQPPPPLRPHSYAPQVPGAPASDAMHTKPGQQ